MLKDCLYYFSCGHSGTRSSHFESGFGKNYKTNFQLKKNLLPYQAGPFVRVHIENFHPTQVESRQNQVSPT